MKASYCNTLNNKETKSPGFSFNQEQIIQKKMTHTIFTETPFHLFLINDAMILICEEDMFHIYVRNISNQNNWDSHG